jgi:hypothetical protein
MKKVLIAVLAITAFAGSAGAQQASMYTFERKISHDEAPQVLLDKIRLEQGQIAIESKVIPNAPYSAEAVNESVQVLPDGNRIVHRTTTRIYRDSAGRTRRETIEPDGQVALIAITDPTTGASTVFDPRSNNVSKSFVRHSTTSSTGSGGSVTSVDNGTTVTLHVTTEDKQLAERAQQMQQAEHAPQMKMSVPVTFTASGGALTFAHEIAKSETTKEDLGRQTIEGLAADGVRTTTIIPAGAVGNEQPIKIVSEEWFSPELQVLVLTKHSDPRTGETTYRLSSVNRTEPAKALFDAPAK